MITIDTKDNRDAAHTNSKLNTLVFQQLNDFAQVEAEAGFDVHGIDNRLQESGSEPFSTFLSSFESQGDS